MLDAQYTAKKAHLRPIHDRLVEHAVALGSDVEAVVQRTGVSLRPAKQFGLIQVPSAKRVQLGLNLPETPSARFEPTSGMCSHRADLTSIDDVDADVVAWLARAYEHAG